MQVVLILEELGVPYTIHSFKFDDVKKPPFINVNPNGRVPGMYQKKLPYVNNRDFLTDLPLYLWGVTKSDRGPEYKLHALGIWSNHTVSRRRIRQKQEADI
jgi:hypothetical protein